MQRQQLELWGSKEVELRLIPPPYQELTPRQRRQIAARLARLILRQIRINPSTTITTARSHER